MKKEYQKPMLEAIKIANSTVLAGSDPEAKKSFDNNIINWEDDNEKEVY